MAGFGFGYRFSRRTQSQGVLPAGSGSILYGPNYGPKGPKKFLVSVWTQNPIGYCYETDSRTENLYAKWKSRGVNTLKHQHPDFVAEGFGDNVLAACKAEGLMLLSAPTWPWWVRPTALDYRLLAMTDPYWRTNWIAYSHLDEPDLYTIPQSVHFAVMDSMELGGVRKPGVVNFTWRISSPSVGSGVGNGGTVADPVIWKEFMEAPQVQEITHDTYNWHLEGSDTNIASSAREQIGYFGTTWNMFGPYFEDKDPSLQQINRSARGRRFTATKVGLNVHMTRGGLFIAKGGTVPQPLAYAPGDKATGHYAATGRVDFTSQTFFRGGFHQPARFLRDDIWSGVVHGSSHLLIFPQAPSGITVTGFVDAATNRFTVTSTAPHGRANITGAMSFARADTGVFVGWILRDNYQISGTPNGAGVYALDSAKVTTVTAGSVGTPIQFVMYAAEGTSGDGTNAACAAELTTSTANFTRMQAHPTGGNLLMDTQQGGRRAFTVMRCPDMSDDSRLYKEDMTLAPIQAGYTSGGVAVLDQSGDGPGWAFGWPMGFEGFRVVGNDGATYIYVRSLSNSSVLTWFSGYAALGLPARAFGPFELAGFRRVGVQAAVEMTGTSGVIKAGVDDGAATFFYIETASISQNEGNSGTTAYAFTMRRGGNISGTNTVTATVSGTGANPANAADFQGGAFPSQVLSFGAGETTKTFTVNVVGDTVSETNETFAVSLSAPSGGAGLVASGKNTVTNTIVNDEVSPIAALIANSATLAAYEWTNTGSMTAGAGGSVSSGSKIDTVPNAKNPGTLNLRQTVDADRPTYTSGAVHDGASDFMRVSFAANAGPANATLVYVVKTTDDKFMLGGTNINGNFAGVGDDGVSSAPDSGMAGVTYAANGSVLSSPDRNALRDAWATGSAVTARIVGADYQDAAITDIRNAFSNNQFPFFINGNCMLIAVLNAGDSNYAAALTLAEAEAARVIAALGL